MLSNNTLADNDSNDLFIQSIKPSLMQSTTIPTKGNQFPFVRYQEVTCPQVLQRMDPREYLLLELMLTSQLYKGLAERSCMLSHLLQQQQLTSHHQNMLMHHHTQQKLTSHHQKILIHHHK